MQSKLLLLLLLPAIVQAQSGKEEFNIYREVGLSYQKNSFGIHYNWQAQVSKKWYFGTIAEALRFKSSDKETPYEGNILLTGFRLNYIPKINGVRLVSSFGAGVVLTQPTGTMLEGGLGVAAGKWQVAASYRKVYTDIEHSALNSGIFLRFSRLLITKAKRPRFK